MIPAAFDFHRADTADAALALLAEHGDEAKLLAGGHSLLPMMKLRLATPAVLIGVGRIEELSYIRADDEHIAVGALTRHQDLVTSALLREQVPLLAHVAGLVGDLQVRHRGTLGGSLVHGDPAADLPAAVLALDATLVIRGPAGTRAVPADEFFTGFLETVVGPEEMLIEVRIPSMPGAGWAYEKFTRRANDWAIVAVAAAGGRLALANMAGTPVRATETEQALAAGGSIDEAAHLADRGLAGEPPEDMHGDRAYRRHLARVLTGRALRTAQERVG
ncbi:MAG TPA: xanthine dehydrogenase family protein subunit M [Mycobacteriales bacterium]|nr:xanthine dehydrogenase family protein subunit M [Mycobacteriales bacterium]